MMVAHYNFTKNENIRQILNNKNKIFFIAEAGVNHNGSLEIAKKLIDIAVNSGADAVKFQTLNVKNYWQKMQKMKHQTRSNNKISQFRLLKRLELTDEQLIKLKNYSRKK